MWNSTSPNGWLYLIVLRGPRFMIYVRVCGNFRKSPSGVEDLPGDKCIVTVFWIFPQKLPRGTIGPPDDSTCSTQFLGFIWTAWQWWTPARRHESILLGVLGGFLSGERKLYLGGLLWLEVNWVKLYEHLFRVWEIGVVGVMGLMDVWIIVNMVCVV